MQVRILGTRIDSLTMEQALTRVEDYFRRGTPHRIVTLNAEMAYLAYRDDDFRQIVNGADMVTADGSGILWAARKLGTPLPERVAGIDLMQALAAKAAAGGYSIYLYGAAPGIAAEAAAELQQSYPLLKIAGTSHGYLSEAEQIELIGQIQQLRPDILLVALGAPRQEIWIARHLAELQVPVTLGVGGSFDVIAGRVKRAPRIWQELKLEWLYRILQEPKRFKRALALPKFVWTVLTRGNRYNHSENS